MYHENVYTKTCSDGYRTCFPVQTYLMSVKCNHQLLLQMKITFEQKLNQNKQDWLKPCLRALPSGNHAGQVYYAFSLHILISRFQLITCHLMKATFWPYINSGC